MAAYCGILANRRSVRERGWRNIPPNVLFFRLQFNQIGPSFPKQQFAFPASQCDADDFKESEAAVHRHTSAFLQETTFVFVYALAESAASTGSTPNRRTSPGQEEHSSPETAKAAIDFAHLRSELNDRLSKFDGL